MTLEEFSTQITSKQFKTDTASVAACKGFVRNRYRMIYDGSLWRDSLVVSTVAATSNILTMPAEQGLIVGIRWNQTMIDAVELSYLLRSDPTAFERTGTPSRFAELEPIGLSSQPTSEKLKVVSSSSSDTSLTVLLRGSLAGVEQYEELTLNGTMYVSSTQSWDAVDICAKDSTAGTVTVKGVTSGTTYLTMFPYETEKKYLRVQLYDSPTDVTQNLLVLGKRRYRDLWLDQDTPIIRGIENALLAFVASDMLERERQYGKAQLKIQEAGAMLGTAMNMGVYQTATTQQVTPDAIGEWTRNDFV